MDDFAEQLWSEFAAETDEHLQAIEPILAQADAQNAADADIAQLFRSFHSIKGLARAMDAVGMEGVAHQAENLLGLVRDGRTALTPPMTDLLLQSVDALKAMRDGVCQARQDVPAEPGLVSRLNAAFTAIGAEDPADTPAGTTVSTAPAAPEPSPGAGDTSLHEDAEMLAIFVEMVKARGPELCAALAEEAAQRDVALDAAESLGHAAEVMNFDALAETFGSLREVLQSRSGGGKFDEPTRQDLLSRLGDIRLQIELVGEISGHDAGIAEFSAALAERIGDERLHLVEAALELNERLREHLAEREQLAAEADAAAITRYARIMHSLCVSLSLGRTAEMLLLIEDLYGRIAGGETALGDALVDAVRDFLLVIAEHAQTGRIEDLTEAQSIKLTTQLRASLETGAFLIAQRDGAGRLVAGIHVPSELLVVMSDENLVELENRLEHEKVAAYVVLVHLEADPEIGQRLISWLTTEARAITNRTVVAGHESWFEFLVLSQLEPAAFVAELHHRDTQGHCVKRVQRLTAASEGEVLDRSASSADASPAPGAAAQPAAASNLIRVRGEIIDAFLDEIGELRVVVESLTHLIRGVGSRKMVTRAQAFVDRLPRDLRNEFLASFQDFRDRDRRLLETEGMIAGLLGRLHQSALELRVVPIDAVFNRLPRLVRDLAQRQGKSVELVLEGRDVRIDKSMVEALADPLIHMVRNAIDHGIEAPGDREAAGKPARARLTLTAAQRGSEIHIEVTDEGRGLDVKAIRAKAAARGLASEAQIAAMPDSRIYRFIFAAGLSTSAQVTETSGRGVGMDIVLATVRRLNGDITVRSEPGRGATFTLILPVSAALQTALVVRVGEQSLAIPERHIAAVAEIESEAVEFIGRHRSFRHRNAMLPLFDLGALLGMPGTASGRGELEPVVIATNTRRMIGLGVDAIEQRLELFLKDLDPRLAQFPGVGGASVLGDGRVVLVLDGDELIQLAEQGVGHAELTAH
ncbi:MAG: chemotaxis protein CheW [Alphaproteobacteria bacterium]|nr:chemotaxis protein CheW [Alphaproteobacteria bacterium]